MAFLFDWETMEPAEYTRDEKHGSVVSLGERNYLSIVGRGDEHSTQFMSDAKTLYALGDYLTKAVDHGIKITGFKDFVHYPLDVNWQGSIDGPHERYQMLMKQPNFMPKAAVDLAVQQLSSENSNVENVDYIRFAEGLEAQIGLQGTDNRADVGQRLQAFVDVTPFEMVKAAKWHRELYLTDISKIKPDQWQKILRTSLAADPAAETAYPIIVN